jgi:hypothetical protein
VTNKISGLQRFDISCSASTATCLQLKSHKRQVPYASNFKGLWDPTHYNEVEIAINRLKRHWLTMYKPRHTINYLIWRVWCFSFSWNWPQKQFKGGATTFFNIIINNNYYLHWRLRESLQDFAVFFRLHFRVILASCIPPKFRFPAVPSLLNVLQYLVVQWVSSL